MSGTDKTQTRPPIVVVMGHVDHGKTTLLDAIRNADVVSGEAGGITQHVGAYSVEHNGQQITFIDTPGHEAFSKIRERGARAADVAILIVAADDGIKPQTLEALEAIRAAEIPFIVAINKIDKEDANPERVKKELAEHDVLIEEWGGKIPSVLISAKEKQGFDDLLELVLIVGELEELAASASEAAEGVVVESHRDDRRGNTAVMLIQNGTLREGDFLLAGIAITKVKLMEDHLGNRIKEAGPSTPVRIVGFDVLPSVGAVFTVYPNKKALERAAKEAHAEERATAQGSGNDGEEKRHVLPVFVKGDVAGSKEALEDALRKISFSRLELKFLPGGVGDITEGDIKLVGTERDLISPLVIGLGVKATADALAAAERFEVIVETFDIIYKAVEWAEEMMRKSVPREVVEDEHGTLEVLKVFSSQDGKNIIGGKVIDGAIGEADECYLVRNEKRIAKGKIVNLETEKQKVNEVQKGALAGLAVKMEGRVVIGDHIVGFSKRELEA